MANMYKDEAGHWTTKENDGGPCYHKIGKKGNKYHALGTNGESEELDEASLKLFRDNNVEEEAFDDDYEAEFNEEQLDGNKQDKYRAAKTNDDKDEKFINNLNTLDGLLENIKLAKTDEELGELEDTLSEGIDSGKFKEGTKTEDVWKAIDARRDELNASNKQFSEQETIPHKGMFKAGDKVMFGGEEHEVVRNKGYDDEFKEDNLVLKDKDGNFKHVGSRDIYLQNRKDNDLSSPEEFAKKTAKMPNGKEMTLFEFAHNIINYLDTDTASAIVAARFGVSENDAKAYLESPFNTEGNYEEKLARISNPKEDESPKVSPDNESLQEFSFYGHPITKDTTGKHDSYEKGVEEAKNTKTYKAKNLLEALKMLQKDNPNGFGLKYHDGPEGRKTYGQYDSDWKNLDELIAELEKEEKDKK